MKLEDAIKQKEFKSIFQKALLNIHYTNNRLFEWLTNILKPYGLSLPQYNILRILRGNYPQTSSIAYIKQRMLDKMPDVSRMIERLKKKGLVTRETCEKDRREVEIQITQEGIRLLNELDSVEKEFEKFFRHLSEEEIKQLNYLLDKMRG